MFQDRKDAGMKLAQLLKGEKGSETLVLSIPRGGIEVGLEIARGIGSRMSVLITRKMPFPDHPEAGFGAITEDGTIYTVPGYRDRIPRSMKDDIAREQIEKIKELKSVLRSGRPLPNMEGRKVILVDDGIAMGSTMLASIACVKNRNPSKLIVAVPVASPHVKEEMERFVDRMVVVETPGDFHAVAQVYNDWYDVSTQEALGILQKANEEGIYL